MRDRLWFPMAHRRQPIAHLPQLHALHAIFEQSNKVLAAIDAKNKLVFDRFFNVVKYNIPPWVEEAAPGVKAKELSKRMDKIDAAQAAIYKLAEPKPHKFSVTPAK